MLNDEALYTAVEKAFDAETIDAVTKASNESTIPVDNMGNKTLRPFEDGVLGQKVIDILQKNNIWNFDCQALDSMIHFTFENGSHISWRRSLRYGLPDMDVKLTYIVKLYEASFEPHYPLKVFCFDTSLDEDRFKSPEECAGLYDLTMQVGDMVIIPAYTPWCIEPVQGRQDYLIGDVLGRPWR